MEVGQVHVRSVFTIIPLCRPKYVIRLEMSHAGLELVKMWLADG